MAEMVRRNFRPRTQLASYKLMLGYRLTDARPRRSRLLFLARLARSPTLPPRHHHHHRTLDRLCCSPLSSRSAPSRRHSWPPPRGMDPTRAGIARFRQEVRTARHAGSSRPRVAQCCHLGHDTEGHPTRTGSLDERSSRQFHRSVKRSIILCTVLVLTDPPRGDLQTAQHYLVHLLADKLACPLANSSPEEEGRRVVERARIVWTTSNLHKSIPTLGEWQSDSRSISFPRERTGLSSHYFARFGSKNSPNPSFPPSSSSNPSSSFCG